MSIGRVLNDSEFGDVVVRKTVAQVFLFFLPGLASGLKQIALEDEKIGHNVTQVNVSLKMITAHILMCKGSLFLCGYISEFL